MARDINLGCALSCAHHFYGHSVCYSCIPANLVSQMVLGQRLLSENSARYSIFVELLIFVTNERAPPTRVKKTISNAALLRIYWLAQGRLETWVGSGLPKHLNNKKVEVVCFLCLFFVAFIGL